VTWSTTRPPITNRNRAVPRNTPRKHVRVATLRFHPRSCSRSTAGSTANDRNSDTTTSRRRPLSWAKMYRPNW